MEFEIDLDRAVGTELDLPLGRGVADGRSDEGEAARGKVLQEEMSRGVGGGADRGTLQGQCGIGDVLAGAGIDDMARDVGVGMLSRGGLVGRFNGMAVVCRNGKYCGKEERTKHSAKKFFHRIGFVLLND